MVVWAHTATEYNRASKLKLGKVSLPSHISLPPPIPIWEKRKERKCWRSPLACRTQLACQIGRAAGTPTCQLLLPLRYVPPGTMEELSFCFCFFFFASICVCTLYALLLDLFYMAATRLHDATIGWCVWTVRWYHRLLYDDAY
jgi:hypothetical protein